MSDLANPIGQSFVLPGMSGRVVGILKDFLVVEGTIDGEIPIHKAEADELAVVLSGRLRVTVDGVEREAGPGAYLIFSAGCEHGAIADEPARMRLREPVPASNLGS